MSDGIMLSGMHRSWRTHLFAVPLGLAVSLFGPSLLAEEVTPEARASAVELFDAAGKLKAEGHLTEACSKYQESYRLDPQLGALLHLADCLEQDGKFASSYASFRAAAELAELKGDERKALAEERCSALAPKLTRLTIEVPAPARLPGLEVSRDGVALAPGIWGTPIALDAGEHRLRVTAPGHTPWEYSITVHNNAANLRVEVPQLEVLGAAPPATPAPSPTVPGAQRTSEPANERWATGSRLKLAGYVVGGAGVVGAAVGGVFWTRRASEIESSEGICPTGVCAVGTGAASQASINQHLNAARSAQTIAIVSLAAGGALLATGTLLLVLGSRKHPTEQARLELVPAIDSRNVGVLAQGVF